MLYYGYDDWVMLQNQKLHPFVGVYLIIVDHIIPITKAPRLRECITRYGSNQNSLRVEK